MRTFLLRSLAARAAESTERKLTGQAAYAYAVARKDPRFRMVSDQELRVMVGREATRRAGGR